MIKREQYLVPLFSSAFHGILLNPFLFLLGWIPKEGIVPVDHPLYSIFIVIFLHFVYFQTVMLLSNFFNAPFWKVLLLIGATYLLCYCALVYFGHASVERPWHITFMVASLMMPVWKWMFKVKVR